jgi:hypothetical protein
MIVSLVYFFCHCQLWHGYFLFMLVYIYGYFTSGFSIIQLSKAHEDLKLVKLVMLLLFIANDYAVLGKMMTNVKNLTEQR